MTETEACIAINMIPKMGPVRLRKLLEVFESPQRILSAKAAGMYAVGVTTVAPEAALLDAGADWIVRDFRTLPLDLAALLFRPG